MVDTRDPAIKLFGKTISVPDFPLNSRNHSLRSPTLAPSPSSSSSAAVDDSVVEPRSSSSTDRIRSRKDVPVEEEQRDCKRNRIVQDGDHHLLHHRLLCLENTADSAMAANPTRKPPSKTSSSPTAAELAEASTSQEKMLKKPDKVLPCPRCNSLETKFCYYNNYNVNQPRHFCKNCQRYWTAGGTMRNVPIGAGRRKHKTYTSHCRHITISDRFLNTQPTTTDVSTNGDGGGGGLVLAFGADQSVCNSGGVIHSADGSRCSVSRGGGDQVSEPLMAEAAKNVNPIFPIQMPCFVSTTPWHYPWGQWSSSDSMPLPAQNALYWDASVPRRWNVNLPCISFPSCENQAMSSSASPSSAMGKSSGMEASNPTEPWSGKLSPAIRYHENS